MAHHQVNKCKLLVNIWRDNQFICDVKCTNEKWDTISHQPAPNIHILLHPTAGSGSRKGIPTDHWHWPKGLEHYLAIAINILNILSLTYPKG